jgi:hypothetical protein
MTFEEFTQSGGFGEQIHCGCGHFNGWRDIYCKKCSLLREKAPNEKEQDFYNNRIVNDIKVDRDSGYILCRTCSRLKDRQRICVTCGKFCYNEFFTNKAYCDKCGGKDCEYIEDIVGFSDAMVKKIISQGETIDQSACIIC